MGVGDEFAEVAPEVAAFGGDSDSPRLSGDLDGDALERATTAVEGLALLLESAGGVSILPSALLASRLLDFFFFGGEGVDGPTSEPAPGFHKNRLTRHGPLFWVGSSVILNQCLCSWEMEE